MKKRIPNKNKFCLLLTLAARDKIRQLPPNTNITAYIIKAILAYEESK